MVKKVVRWVFAAVLTGMLVAWILAFISGRVLIPPPWYLYILVGVGSGIFTVADYIEILKGRGNDKG